jgi:hypothetical protein
MSLMQGYVLWMSPCFPGSFGDSGCFDRCVQARELFGDYGPLNRLRFRFTIPTQPAGQLLQAQGVPVDHAHVQYVTGAYVIGDAGFKCKQGMIVPFCGRNVANLSPEQAAFNTALSKQRMEVEQSYGMMKKRWRRLVHTGLDDADLVALTLRVCIVLSNFLMRKGFARMADAERRRPLATDEFTVGGQHLEAWAAEWMETGEPIEIVSDAIVSDANGEQKRDLLVQYVNNFATLNQARHWREWEKMHSVEYRYNPDVPHQAAEVPPVEFTAYAIDNH